MKIAVIGQNVDEKKKLLNSFCGICSSYGHYQSDIYNFGEEGVEPDILAEVEKVKLNDGWNDTEKELYKRICLLTTQHDKAKDKENVIWVGHSLDILVETITLNSMEEVGDEFVEKIIYWNKKLMKKLDLIYWLPDADKILPEIKDDEEIDLEKWFAHSAEVAYNNIWTDYIKNFDKSEILPRECPGMGVFETADYAAELADIVNDLHETDGKDTRLDDIEKLNSIIKDKRLLKNIHEILATKTIPLPDGNIVTSGEIKM
jgi:hypothetical protein